MFAILSDAAQAYNDIPWEDAVPFLICIVGIYWIKKVIDLRFAKKQSNIVYKVRIVEGHIDIDHGDVVTHPKSY
tara:strand:+ start:127 stop:348 length:222 start_codon:yes stop_codon:yes gene_type:complete